MYHQHQRLSQSDQPQPHRYPPDPQPHPVQSPPHQSSLGWVPPPLPPPRFVPVNQPHRQPAPSQQPLTETERRSLLENPDWNRSDSLQTYGKSAPELGQTATARPIKQEQLRGPACWSRDHISQVYSSAPPSLPLPPPQPLVKRENSSSTPRPSSFSDLYGTSPPRSVGPTIGSLPSFATLMADEPSQRPAAPDPKAFSAYDQSQLSRLNPRPDPLLRGLAQPNAGGPSPNMPHLNDPATPKSYDGFQMSHMQPGIGAGPRIPEPNHLGTHAKSGTLSPSSSGHTPVSGHPVPPGYLPMQYTLDNRYFPYGAPRGDSRVNESLQGASTEYRDVGQEQAALQQLHLRESTPDAAAKAGQKRRANSPPTTSIPPSSTGVPFNRRGVMGHPISYPGTPGHPQLDSNGYPPGSYASPSAWSAGPAMSNPPLPHYALPDGASAAGSPYSGLPPTSSGVMGHGPGNALQAQPMGRHMEIPSGTANSAPQGPGAPTSVYGASAAPRIDGAYICECCPKKPKKFDSLDSLRAHEGEKQYACVYCTNRFKNKNEAERHQNSLHLRPHSWSCAALQGVQAAFHATSSPMNRQLDAPPATPTTSASDASGPAVTPARSDSGPQRELSTSASSTTKGLQRLQVSDSDSCGYCGKEFPNDPEPNWAERVDHITQDHKFGECNQNKKFFRADHFRQHLKHSHAGTSGKWTNMLEAACMRVEQPPVPIARTMADHTNSPAAGNGVVGIGVATGMGGGSFPGNGPPGGGQLAGASPIKLMHQHQQLPMPMQQQQQQQQQHHYHHHQHQHLPVTAAGGQLPHPQNSVSGSYAVKQDSGQGEPPQQVSQSQQQGGDGQPAAAQ